MPLREELKELHLRLSEEFEAEFRRNLSFSDMLFDRFERARSVGFGEGTSVYQQCLIIGDVAVGKNTWIGPGTVLDGSGGLSIGDNCSISAGVQVYSHDTVQRRLSDGKFGPTKAPTEIGSSCYIGPNSIITKGVSIGHHSVVGALSLLRESIPPHSVAFGVPARIRGTVCFRESGEAYFEWNGDSSLEERIATLEKELASLQGEK